LGTIVVVVILRKLAQKFHLPQIDMLLALIVASVVAAWFEWSKPGLDGKTLVSVVGSVPRSLPLPHVPEIKFWWIKELSGSALAIAFLGLLEALAIAKSIATYTRQHWTTIGSASPKASRILPADFFNVCPAPGR
jgi:sulfate permease, SulP family